MKTLWSKQYLDIQRSAPSLKLKEALKKHFPSYLSQPTCFHCSSIWYGWHLCIQWIIQLGIKLILRPRKDSGNTLDPHEVDEVYDREAATYDRKHHLTTRGKDTSWRRYAGWQVATFGSDRAQPLAILDLCTGTGLTVVEMTNILSSHSITATIVGLDRNQAMLGRAHTCCPGHLRITTQFVQGDATNLVDVEHTNDGWTRFPPNTFDAVVQVFGIGGINEPIRVFEGVLTVLKESGQFVLVDMHVPISDQSGEWPLLLKWLRTPLLEMITYQQTTIPLALRRLWAWRDPTLDFYFLPLVTHRDPAANEWWGFEVISRTVESERWWLSLPLMPVARMVVRKVRLSPLEGIQRQELLIHAKSLVVP